MKMSCLNTCAIIIPVYKEVPDKNEERSLIQVFKVLKEFNFCLVCSDNLNIAYYYDIANLHQVDMVITTFHPNYFANLTGYNKLLLSLDFYKRFISFKYILIYQLDAWVFRDELNYWCQQNYDYIGAPWIYKNIEGDRIFAGVGNGGFSLRKVHSHIKALKSFALINTLGYAFYLFKNESQKYGPAKSFIKNFVYNNSYYRFNRFSENEDVYWGIFVSGKFKWFNVPNEATASKFSVELMPTFFINSKYELPFGCHAWEKYEPDFWKNHI